jgi:DNA processing protein
MTGDQEPWLVALATLPGMGPARLGALLAVAGDPESAWTAVCRGATGVPEAVASRWVAAARSVDVAARWAAHAAAGVQVLCCDAAGWPAPLHDDPEPPAVLFARGDLGALDRPRVAVVGTRHCSHTGRDVAHELGHELGRAGVCVVSGLALGIDGAAHRGALLAGTPPVGVVGTGLDVVYPRRHADLWAEVSARGLLVSEYPLGVGPEPWRFPARNRILAAFADVVVVVESHERGGSLHTVESAIERGRTVMAVPGSVRNPASRGTNALLAAGCAPVRDATDVLVTLGLESEVWGRAPAAPTPDGEAGRVLDALGWDAATLEQVADRLGVPLGPVAVHLLTLEQQGWVASRSGWYERLR